jgi:hypothetical protein
VYVFSQKQRRLYGLICEGAQFAMSGSWDDSPEQSSFERAARQAATRMTRHGLTAYGAAAYMAVPKAAFLNYAQQVMASIIMAGRANSAMNQQTGARTTSRPLAQTWLDTGSAAGFVHFFTSNPPPPNTYRAYVCAQLPHAGTLLLFLLTNYPFDSPLEFKVATHDAARTRNDTIVSWHATLADARTWIDSVRNHGHLMEGNVPAGVYGGAGNPSIGIDEDLEGQSSTGKIADRAKQITDQHIPRSTMLSRGGYHEV